MGAVARAASPVPERQGQRRRPVQGHLDPGRADAVRICLGQRDLSLREGEVDPSRRSPLVLRRPPLSGMPDGGHVSAPVGLNLIAGPGFNPRLNFRIRFVLLSSSAERPSKAIWPWTMT